MNEPHRREACPQISKFLTRLADKWSVMVLMMLNQKRQRFSELRREIRGISPRMLTLTLRNLERDGLVRRLVTPSTPPRVDYELTDLGRSMCDPVQALGGWVIENLATIDASRSAFDRDKTS